MLYKTQSSTLRRAVFRCMVEIYIKNLLFTSTRRRAVFRHMVEVCFMKPILQRADEQFKVNGGGGGDP